MRTGREEEGGKKCALPSASLQLAASSKASLRGGEKSCYLQKEFLFKGGTRIPSLRAGGLAANKLALGHEAGRRNSFTHRYINRPPEEVGGRGSAKKYR